MNVETQGLQKVYQSSLFGMCYEKLQEILFFFLFDKWEAVFAFQGPTTFLHFDDKLYPSSHLTVKAYCFLVPSYPAADSHTANI